MLSFKNVTKVFYPGTADEKKALDDVSFVTVLCVVLIVFANSTTSLISFGEKTSFSVKPYICTF